MNRELAMKDLVCLVADKNLEESLRGLLARPKALRVRELSCQIYVHAEHDPGCLLRSQDFLRPFVHQYQHALVVLDRVGSGLDGRPGQELEEKIERQLQLSGWEGRAAAIVIDPELESWVWSESPHVASALGWSGTPKLREWLIEQGYVTLDGGKPRQPKEAVEAALRKVRKPRSSALYRQLASNVSFQRCTDRAFGKLLTILRTWFPPAS
jgi:hypothetical protein